MPKKLTQEEFIKKATEKHNNKYIYSLVEYDGAFSKIKIICPISEHGIFIQSPDAHSRGQGCPKCKGGVSVSQKEFIEKAKTIHGDLYIYSLVNYINNITQVTIICNEHGSFQQTPANHLNSSGCQKCIGRNKTWDEVLLIANKIHNHKFKYQINKDKTPKNKEILEITCHNNHNFRQTIKEHLNGQGCPFCVGKHKTTKTFINEASIIHNYYYDYSLVEYINAKTKIKIICPKHGIFEQIPDSHLYGCGCQKCSHTISSPETLWLDLNNIPTQFRNKRLYLADGSFIKPDGFDPLTNTVYEFYGDYYHGNPNIYPPNKINNTNKKPFGELYQKTLIREQKIKNAGYNLVTIWENDWNLIK